MYKKIDTMALPLIAGMAALGALSKGVGMIGASRDQKQAMKQLRALQATARPTYSFDPTLSQIGRTSLMDAYNPSGFSQGEINAFNQNINRGMNTQMARGTSLAGGSQARALNAVMGANQMNAYNTLAMNDATLRRNSKSTNLNRAMQVANARQGISNMQTNQDLNYRNQLEQGYGTAARMSKDYMRGTLSGLGDDMISGATMLGMYGDGGEGFNFGQEESLPKGGGIDFNRLTPRAKYMMGRNPFRQ